MSLECQNDVFQRDNSVHVKGAGRGSVSCPEDTAEQKAADRFDSCNRNLTESSAVFSVCADHDSGRRFLKLCLV